MKEADSLCDQCCPFLTGETPTRKRKGNLVDRINASSKCYVVFDVTSNGLKSKYDIISVDTLICCFNMK